MHYFSIYCVLKMTFTFGCLEVSSQAQPGPKLCCSTLAYNTNPIIPPHHLRLTAAPQAPKSTKERTTTSSCSPSRLSITSPYKIYLTTSRWLLPQNLLLFHPPHCALWMPQRWGAELPSSQPHTCSADFPSSKPDWRLACYLFWLILV